MALQNKLRAGGHLQVATQALSDRCLLAAQQARKSIFRQGIRHRCHRAENGRRVGTQRHRDGKGFTGMGLLPFAKIQRPAPLRQPAHNRAVFADHLHAVNTQVLPLFLRPPCHHQRPGNQRPGVFRPAGLNGQFAEIDLVAFEHDLLTDSFFNHVHRHIQHRFKGLALVPQILDAFGWIGFFQKGQQLADIAQCCGTFLPHTQRHPFRGAE